jgi:hypothetical protein
VAVERRHEADRVVIVSTNKIVDLWVVSDNTRVSGEPPALVRSGVTLAD